MDKDDLRNRFQFHPATEDTGPKHDEVRHNFSAFADYMDDLLPEGREKSLVVTKLEEAMFWANAAIAREATKPLSEWRP